MVSVPNTTNTTNTTDTSCKYCFPGTGTYLSTIEAASGRKADVICGKPSKSLMELLLMNEGVTDPQTCLMVGDRLMTDIAFGKNSGTRTLHVLYLGVRKAHDMDKIQNISGLQRSDTSFG